MYPSWRHPNEWRGPAQNRAPWPAAPPPQEHREWVADSWQEADEWLLRRVVAGLTQDRGVQGGRVVVTVRDTVVVLEGEVDSDAAWVSAARVAWAVPGISDVANRLVVRPTPS